MIYEMPPHVVYIRALSRYIHVVAIATSEHEANQYMMAHEAVSVIHEEGPYIFMAYSHDKG